MFYFVVQLILQQAGWIEFLRISVYIVTRSLNYVYGSCLNRRNNRESGDLLAFTSSNSGAVPATVMEKTNLIYATVPIRRDGKACGLEIALKPGDLP